MPTSCSRAMGECEAGHTCRLPVGQVGSLERGLPLGSRGGEGIHLGSWLWCLPPCGNPAGVPTSLPRDAARLTGQALVCADALPALARGPEAGEAACEPSEWIPALPRVLGAGEAARRPFSGFSGLHSYPVRPAPASPSLSWNTGTLLYSGGTSSGSQLGPAPAGTVSVPPRRRPPHPSLKPSRLAKPDILSANVYVSGLA